VGEIKVATRVMPDQTRAVLIAGPTASGKSALALAVAEQLDGVVINADSMQIYRDLRILTARPSPDEEARVPHRLYGHVDAALNYSVGRYVTEATEALALTEREGKLPIFVGGTGLYFKALTRGLAAMPAIPGPVRKAVRERLAAEGPEALHAELARVDAISAERLKPTDRQRIARALEVVLATGRALSDWHAADTTPLLDPARIAKLFVSPDRAELYARIDARFDVMLTAGALDEVKKLAARQLDPQLPAMKAHGVPWLIQHLEDRMTLVEAAQHAKLDVRHYAKRQYTWFRHQLADWTPASPTNARDHILRNVVR
jgi:tRNA dimethylallyltransferase